jgi:hypothetical protein
MEYCGQQDLTEVSGMVDRPRNALKERFVVGGFSTSLEAKHDERSRT